MTKHNSKIKKQTQDSQLLNLPDEMKLHIMSFLGRRALVRTGRVCKELHNLSNDKSIEKVPEYRHVSNPELLFKNVITIGKSVDGRYIAILTRNDQNNFCLWDIKSNQIALQITINDHLNASSIKLAMTPDNKHLIINYYKIYSPRYGAMHGSSFSYIDIWDLEKKMRISSHDNITKYSGAYLDLPYPHVEVISNEKFLVSLLSHYSHTRDIQSFYLCNTTSHEIEKLDAKTPNSEYKNGQYVTACISPDKKLLARIVNLDLEIHNANTGKKMKSFFLTEFVESISSMQMQFLSDNKTICMIGSEYVAPQAPVNPNKPKSYLMKINYVTGVRERLNIEVPPNPLSRVNSFTLLPNHHVAIIDKYDENHSLGNEILIYDLTNQELIKKINTPVKSILSNNDGSQMYIIDDRDQLCKVTVPMVARELDYDVEQVASASMRI